MQFKLFNPTICLVLLMDSSATTAERKDNLDMAGTFLFAAPTSLLGPLASG